MNSHTFVLSKTRPYSLLQVFKVHQALSPISPMFSIAAAFGNVHGVYKVHFQITFFWQIPIYFPLSGWQRGAVPPVVERAPRLCEGAVEVLRGKAPLPRHARWQRVLGRRDWGSGSATVLINFGSVTLMKSFKTLSSCVRWATVW